MLVVLVCGFFPLEVAAPAFSEPVVHLFRLHPHDKSSSPRLQTSNPGSELLVPSSAVRSHFLVDEDVESGQLGFFRAAFWRGSWPPSSLHSVTVARLEPFRSSPALKPPPPPGGVDGDGHLFWDCPSPSLVSIWEHPEFLPLMVLDRSSWPRCLAWHGWLPTLSSRRVQPPWAVAEVDSIDAALETALGAYPIHPGEAWSPGWDPEDVLYLTDNVPNHPNIWTDGSRDEDLDAMEGAAGSGAFVKDVPWVFDGRAWGHAQDLDTGEDASRIFSMVPGSLQTVQRAEYWGVILALQAFMPVHIGIDNKNVCNNVGRILSGWTGAPFSLCTDGDLLSCIWNMVLYRSASSVKVSKVKGHATDALVAEGRVLKEDKEGNDAADIAADFGRLRQPANVIDARRCLLNAKKRVVS